MSESSDQKILHQKVIEHSLTNNWVEAKAEWDLITIFNKSSKCLCRHPIKENCVIRNRINGEELIVGNVCINQFKEVGLQVEKSCRSSLTKLLASPNTVKASKSLLSLAVRLNILSEAEERNYNKYRTSQQDFVEEMRIKINHLICFGFSPDRPRCPCNQFAKPRKGNGYFYSCCNGFFQTSDTGRFWNNGCGFTMNINNN